MTINKHTVAYLSQYGNAEYFRQNKDLLLYERQIELTGAVDDLLSDLDEWRLCVLLYN